MKQPPVEPASNQVQTRFDGGLLTWSVDDRHCTGLVRLERGNPFGRFECSIDVKVPKEWSEQTLATILQLAAHYFRDCGTFRRLTHKQAGHIAAALQRLGPEYKHLTVALLHQAIAAYGRAKLCREHRSWKAIGRWFMQADEGADLWVQRMAANHRDRMVEEQRRRQQEEIVRRRHEAEQAEAARKREELHQWVAQRRAAAAARRQPTPPGEPGINSGIIAQQRRQYLESLPLRLRFVAAFEAIGDDARQLDGRALVTAAEQPDTGLAAARYDLAISRLVRQADPATIGPRP